MRSLTIALKSADGTTTYAQTKVSGFTSSWKKIDYQLTTSDSQTDTKDARLFIIADQAGSIELTRPQADDG